MSNMPKNQAGPKPPIANALSPVTKDVPSGVQRRDLVAALLGAVGVGAAASALAACATEGGGLNGGPEKIGQAQDDFTTAPLYFTSVGTLGGASGATMRGTPGGSANEIAILEGYTTPGDGGGGIFYWSTTGSDDGGTVFGASTSDAGAPAGYWCRIYSGAVNVRWFGATGGGSTSDSTAIGLAITMVSTTSTRGGTVYFPRGNYLLSVPLSLTTPGLVLQGDGVANTSIIVANGGYGICLTGSGSNYADACAIRDLDITLASPGTSGQVSLYVDGATNVLVERVRFLMAYTAISLGPTSVRTSASLSDVIVFCTVNGSAGNPSGALLLQYIEGLRARNVLVAVTAAVTNFVGINILSPGGGLPDTLSFLDSGVSDQTTSGASSSWTALAISAASGGDFGEWLKLTNCAFESPLWISGAGGSKVYNSLPTVEIDAGASVVFTNCYIKGGYNAVSITGGNGIRLIGCVVVDSAADTILHNGNAPTSIVGSTVGGASQSSSGTYSGIKLGSSSQHCSIIGGSSGNGIAAVPSTQACGITVSNGSATSFFIQGIDCSNNLTAPTNGVIGPTLSSGTTISPTCQVHHVGGTSTIQNITPPGFQGPLVLIPNAAWSTTTGGNIALATAAVVDKALTMTWDSATLAWYPSY